MCDKGDWEGHRYFGSSRGTGFLFAIGPKERKPSLGWPWIASGSATVNSSISAPWCYRSESKRAKLRMCSSRERAASVAEAKEHFEKCSLALMDAEQRFSEAHAKLTEGERITSVAADYLGFSESIQPEAAESFCTRFPAAIEPNAPVGFPYGKEPEPVGVQLCRVHLRARTGQAALQADSLAQALEAKLQGTSHATEVEGSMLDNNSDGFVKGAELADDE